MNTRLSILVHSSIFVVLATACGSKGQSDIGDSSDASLSDAASSSMDASSSVSSRAARGDASSSASDTSDASEAASASSASSTSSDSSTGSDSGTGSDSSDSGVASDSGEDSAETKPALSISLPATTTADFGGTVSFAPTIVGTGTLTYQWSTTPTIAITNNTSSSLTFPELRKLNATDDGRTFTITVTDSYGSTATASTTLDVSGIFVSIATNMVETRGRSGHTATLLADGHTVLVTGGIDALATASKPTALNTAELWDVSQDPPVAVATTGTMTTPRVYHTATLLGNGKVLLAGGDPTGYFSGGYYSSFAAQSSVELFDPETKTFTAVNSPMSKPRAGHVAALLENGACDQGKVLLAGGTTNTADIYDPTSNTVTATSGTLITGRTWGGGAFVKSPSAWTSPYAVLIAGGAIPPNGYVTDLAEYYDPCTKTFNAAPKMIDMHLYATVTFIPDAQQALVYGGQLTVYDEGLDLSTNTWFQTTNDIAGFLRGHTSTLLGDQRVLIAGGASMAPTSAGFRYNPTTRAWSATGSLATARVMHTATWVPARKRVLILGGNTNSYTGGPGIASAEWFK